MATNCVYLQLNATLELLRLFQERLDQVLQRGQAESFDRLDARDERMIHSNTSDTSKLSRIESHVY